METQWSAWLAAEKRAGRGGVVWSEPIVRGLPFEVVLPVPADVSGDAFKLGFANAPDTDAILTKAATVGAFADGYTIVTISLTTAEVGQVATPQTDDDGDGLAEVLAELVWQQGSSGAWRRSSVMSIPISGKVANV